MKNNSDLYVYVYVYIYIVFCRCTDMMLDRYSSYAFQRYAITDVTSYNVRRNDRSIEARVTEFLIFESNVPTLTSSRVYLTHVLK